MDKFVVTPQNYYSQHPDNPYRYKLELHRLDPILWYVERWGGKASDMVWSMNEGYENHEWDGTEDPLSTLWRAIGMKIKRVSAASATAMGKTYLASLMCFWFMDVYPNCTIVTTSTKFSQLKNTLWKEIGKHFVKFKKFYPNARLNNKGTSLGVYLDLTLDDGDADQRMMIGTTEQTSSGEEVSVSAAGQHAENMLILLDEGSGISRSILEAYINTATGGNNIICMLGNPVSQLDTLAYFSQKPTVLDIRISAYDHPNVVGKQEKIKGAVTIGSVEDRREEYGEEHPLYLARVRGISPSENKDSLLKIQEINECYKRTLDYQGYGASAGIDVANSVDKDKACLAIFEGNVLTYMKDFACPDANAIALNLLHSDIELMEELSKYRDDGKERNYDLPVLEDYGLSAEDVMIDSVGVGVGTINEFYSEGHDVQSFAGGSRAIEGLIPLDGKGRPLYTFYNLRAQAFYLLMEDIKKKRISLQIPKQTFHRLKLELASFKADKQVAGRGFKLELKSMTKRRMAGDSPNLADALVMANLMRRMKEEGVYAGSYGVHL